MLVRTSFLTCLPPILILFSFSAVVDKELLRLTLTTGGAGAVSSAFRDCVAVGAAVEAMDATKSCV